MENIQVSGLIFRSYRTLAAKVVSFRLCYNLGCCLLVKLGFYIEKSAFENVVFFGVAFRVFAFRNIQKIINSEVAESYFAVS